MEKFDFTKLMNHKAKTNIKVTERNKPNFEKAAVAFYQLLKK